MAEWVDIKDQGLRLISLSSGDTLMVYEPGQHNGARRTCWTMHFPCICTGWDELPLTATDAEAAKLESLHIVGEWAKSLAIEVAEIRGQTIGEAMNAEGNLWDFQTMVLCETCGNKRCPHATDAKRECTGSNEPGQVGAPCAGDGN